MGTGIRVPSSPESLLPSHHALGLLWSSPIYHANMYIRNKAPSPGKRRRTLPPLSHQGMPDEINREKYSFFSNIVWRPDLQHPFYLSPYFLFFLFLFLLLFFKGAVHLKIKQTMSPWNPDCSSTACSQFHIYSCL